MVTAYIMKTKGLQLPKALNFVQKRRRWVHPNPGFMKQLKKYQLRLNKKDFTIKS
jgi:dual specificity MAP kinase phosphatase/dual specificity phosphatase 12